MHLGTAALADVPLTRRVHPIRWNRFAAGTVQAQTSGAVQAKSTGASDALQDPPHCRPRRPRCRCRCHAPHGEHRRSLRSGPAWQPSPTEGQAGALWRLCHAISLLRLLLLLRQLRLFRLQHDYVVLLAAGQLAGCAVPPTWVGEGVGAPIFAEVLLEIGPQASALTAQTKLTMDEVQVRIIADHARPPIAFLSHDAREAALPEHHLVFARALLDVECATIGCPTAYDALRQ
mmetsp:Transcript_153196/g.389184  ORF Transcript_153196/g.389184 Transcript_153196/m.389184 type:complete len:232 (+) Transcript_153196:209-904(+)